MRRFALLVGFWAAACAGADAVPMRGQEVHDEPAAVPIVVRGAGDRDLVVDVRELRAAAGAGPGCWRAVDAATGRELRRRVRGELPELAAAAGHEQVVLVVRGAAERLARIEVATEEGVDVLTLVALAEDPAAADEASAWLLRLERRSHQLAIVVRGAVDAAERTVGVFDGL